MCSLFQECVHCQKIVFTVKETVCSLSEDCVLSEECVHSCRSVFPIRGVCSLSEEYVH